MKYCARCLYPLNARPTINIDEEDGICSGCKYHESRETLEVDWGKREVIFREMMEETKRLAKEKGNLYDCIIPISGGKDSHYQVWLLKEKYGMNPLLVTYNHIFNAASGIRNLINLVEKSGCDLIRFTANPYSVKKISRFMLETVGDLTWHYHAGIMTLPFRVAVEKNIPLVVWGEHGFGELTGMVTLDEFVEFTKWRRKEHDMRGYEPEDVVKKSNGRITMEDLYPYIYPTDEEIERVDVRGIYVTNYFFWNASKHGELMMEKWDFAPVTFKRDRTFNLFSKIEDHANDVHDYLKYLKFGYGRATDDASMEIRHGRMTREEGVQMVKEYDSNEPSSLQTYLDFLEMSKEDFYDLVEHLRDPSIWEKINGEWKTKDSVINHSSGELIENARVNLSDNRTFSEKNRNLYYNEKYPPLKRGDDRLDVNKTDFIIM